ncbi:Dabb family protein [Paenibacillus pinistramenti]|uniref:Dabb family protein n=1 Tax=Paenibacillus pinistramenti TaxID=1768003 RepID=UPI001109423F|nr:Dabb family protein [Paenibacillus pinistramenti]
MFEHVVLIKVKEEFTPDRQEEAVKKSLAFKEQIPGIVSLSAGINVLKGTEHGQGFALAIRVTFEDEQACRDYNVHPAHLSFLQELKPFIEDILVADYPF